MFCACVLLTALNYLKHPIGSSSGPGVFLLSEDGIDQIAHFTTTNSPLLSDNVNSITINSDGEVFFGTARGIISFRGTATPDNPTSSDFYAFPNPVRENYTGLIAIKGVANDSYVKITDTYGTDISVHFDPFVRFEVLHI